MKTFNLFVACSVFALNVMAVEWPDGWQYATGSQWFSEPSIAPSSLAKQEAIAYPVGADFDMEYDFFEPWDNLLGDVAFPIAKFVSVDGANEKPNDGVGTFKVGYNEDNLYVFIQYIDDEDLSGTELAEIAIAPYDKLESSEDFDIMEGLKYVRYMDLGAFKLGIDASGPQKVMVCKNDESACTAGEDSYLGTMLADAMLVDFTDKFASGEDSRTVRWVVSIPFIAMENSLTGEPFTLDTWKTACAGKGMSFDIKFRDADLGSGNTRDYWWNSNSNDGFYSTSYSGYLKPYEDTALEDGAIDNSVSNIKITPTQIELTEAANVQILSAAGMLIKSQNDANFVSTIDLPAGTYIVVSGSEAVTFVK